MANHAIIRFNVSPLLKLDETMINGMFKYDALIKVLVQNLKFRFQDWELNEYEEGRYRLNLNNLLTKDWYLAVVTMEIINGLFDTTCTYLYGEENGVIVNKSRYETRHWHQGTGHEKAVVDMLPSNVTSLNSHL